MPGLTSFPAVIRAYLTNLAESDRLPGFLAINDSGMIVDSGGHLGAYGLSHATAGSSLPQEACFLESLLPVGEEPMFLPCVKTEFALLADVHLFRADHLNWVVLLSAASAEIQTRARHQRFNQERLDHDHPPDPAHRELPVQILSALDLAVLIHKAANRFSVVGVLPGWFRLLWPPGARGGVEISPTSDVLYNFLEDARPHWHSGSAARLRSGAFLVGPDDDGRCLEASALTLGGHPLLILGQPTLDLEASHRYLQTARDRGLALAALGRSEAALVRAHLSLDDEVRQRASELIRLNQILEWELVRRTKAEEENLLLADSVEGSSEMICLLDAGGRITFANRALRERYGYPRAALMDQPLSLLWQPSPAGDCDGLLSDSAQAREMECIHRTQDGTTFLAAARISAAQTRPGDPKGRVVIIRDVTAERQADQARAAAFQTSPGGFVPPSTGGSERT